MQGPRGTMEIQVFKAAAVSKGRPVQIPSCPQEIGQKDAQQHIKKGRAVGDPECCQVTHKRGRLFCHDWESPGINPGDSTRALITLPLFECWARQSTHADLGGRGCLGLRPS